MFAMACSKTQTTCMDQPGTQAIKVAKGPECITIHQNILINPMNTTTVKEIILIKTVICKTDADDTTWYVLKLVSSTDGKFQVPTFTMDKEMSKDFLSVQQAQLFILNFHPGTPGNLFIDQIDVAFDPGPEEIQQQFINDAQQYIQSDNSVIPDPNNFYK
jgi:hypothetical protein